MFGILIFICHIPLFRLLSKEFVLLKCLGKYFPFECTVGQNGRVWINSSSTSHTITIANAITNSEYMTNDQIQTMVKQLMRGVQAQAVFQRIQTLNPWFPSLSHPLYQAHLATAQEHQLTTPCANQTSGLTNGRATYRAPEVEFSPFRALSHQLTFLSCC